MRCTSIQKVRGEKELRIWQQLKQKGDERDYVLVLILYSTVKELKFCTLAIAWWWTECVSYPLDHVTCFGQWGFNRYDTNRGLSSSALVIGHKYMSQVASDPSVWASKPNMLKDNLNWTSSLESNPANLQSDAEVPSQISSRLPEIIVDFIDP